MGMDAPAMLKSSGLGAPTGISDLPSPSPILRLRGPILPIREDAAKTPVPL